MKGEFYVTARCILLRKDKGKAWLRAVRCSHQRLFARRRPRAADLPTHKHGPHLTADHTAEMQVKFRQLQLTPAFPTSPISPSLSPQTMLSLLQIFCDILISQKARHAIQPVSSYSSIKTRAHSRQSPAWLSLSSLDHWHRQCDLIFMFAFKIKPCLGCQQKIAGDNNNRRVKGLRSVGVSILGLRGHSNTQNQIAIHLSC